MKLRCGTKEWTKAPGFEWTAQGWDLEDFTGVSSVTELHAHNHRKTKS